MRGVRSLQGRLLVLVLGLVLASWAAVAAITWRGVRHELDELLDAHLAQAAALLVAQQLGEGDEEHALDAPMLHKYAPRVAFQVFQEGGLHLRSANAPLAPMLPGQGGRADGFHDVHIDGVAWRVFGTVARRGETTVLVGEQKASRSTILRAVLAGTLQPMLLGLPVLALSVWAAVAGGTAPLRRAAAALRARGAGDLSPVAVGKVPTELAPLLEALNAMFERLGELLDSERRFTADAAHELRTPIAAIRAQAQVALEEVDDVNRRRALRQAMDGCDRASRVIEQLLTLSRLEAEPASRLQAVDLAALSREVVAEVAASAPAAQHALGLDVQPGSCQVAGNPTLLKVLMRNLLDNALRYSPRGSAVQVRLQPVGAGGLRWSVGDEGPGMGAADIARLGERFFRVSQTAATGSGLGWSIVRRIAAAHGVELQVTARQPSGLEVALLFSHNGA